MSDNLREQMDRLSKLEPESRAAPDWYSAEQAETRASTVASMAELLGRLLANPGMKLEDLCEDVYLRCLLLMPSAGASRHASASVSAVRGRFGVTEMFRSAPALGTLSLLALPETGIHIAGGSGDPWRM